MKITVLGGSGFLGSHVADELSKRGHNVIIVDNRRPNHKLKNCKFKNCTHINEPNCEVLHAIEDNLIAKSRYKNYLSMLKENTNYRRIRFSRKRKYWSF